MPHSAPNLEGNVMNDDDDARGLIKIPAGEGAAFAVAGATLTWKVRSREAGGDFCLFEQVLQPGEGVPLHTHSYPEAFYVLSGTVDFAAAQEPAKTTQCNAGDVILARPHTKHSFYNTGPGPARMLSISVGAHEAFFDAVQAADKSEPFAALPPDQAMARVAAIGAQTDTNFCISTGAGQAEPA